MNTIKIVTLGVCTGIISACSTINDSSYTTYQPYDATSYYSQTNNSNFNYYSEAQEKGPVAIPESYHVGAYRSPTPAKDHDRSWVSSQNSQSYTIEIADDEKASEVAHKLNQIPKTDRMAEIKYQRDGKAYYKGLYGSYSNQQDAEKALNSLPNDIKKGAGIKNWGSVQSHVME